MGCNAAGHAITCRCGFGGAAASAEADLGNLDLGLALNSLPTSAVRQPEQHEQVKDLAEISGMLDVNPDDEVAFARLTQAVTAAMPEHSPATEVERIAEAFRRLSRQRLVLEAVLDPWATEGYDIIAVEHGVDEAAFTETGDGGFDAEGFLCAVDDAVVDHRWSLADKVVRHGVEMRAARAHSLAEPVARAI